MKAQDLRIKNLVGFVLPDKPVIVSEIVKYNDEYFLETLTIDGETGNVGRPIDNFQPIPLTKEWLVKFGFKKSESDFYYLNHFGIDKDLDAFSFQTCLWTSSNIKSVHSLQNLYFDLTGKELEIKL